MSASLFDPIAFRKVQLKNRIGVSPMCQYSSQDGFATDWHLVHLGSRAVGGAGLVMMEATAVEPRGRISPTDNGIWSDAHIEPLKRITDFIRQHRSVPGVQLAHAGRKSGRPNPWGEPGDLKGWDIVGPSTLPFGKYETPRALSE